MADEERAEEVPALDGQASCNFDISLLKGEITSVETARQHGLKVAEVEGWRDRFLRGAENSLVLARKTKRCAKKSTSARVAGAAISRRANRCRRPV
jgi:hypothetical protein